MATKKGIEVWTDYDSQRVWILHIQKKRGRLTLEEITEACMDYEQDFYMLVICAMDRDVGQCAMDRDVGQYYDTDDLEGDYVTLYRADDFFEWRAKNG